MIKSCQECKTKCCKNGPGPYKPLPFNEWFDKAVTYNGYNTKCENFNEESGNCDVWSTPQLPLACIVYVCGMREYSKEELENIKHWEEQIDLRGMRENSN